MSSLVREYNDELEQTLEGYVQEDKLYDPRTWDWVQYFGKSRDISNYLNDIKTYHKNIIDIKDASKEQIKTIFNNVDSVDQTTANNFQTLEDRLINFKIKVVAIRDLLSPVALNFSPEAFNGLIKKVESQKASILAEIEETGSEEDVPQYVTVDQLKKMGWKNVNNKFVKQLNKTLDKYGITDNKQIRYFLSECFAEIGGDAKHSYLEENGQNKRYAPYYGAGIIQLTFKSGYQAYATYLALQKYSELKDAGITYKNPQHNDDATIDNEYKKLCEKAKELNIDIKQFTDIVDVGPKCVAQNYAFDSAGYFWTTKGIKNTIEKFESDSNENLTTVSHLVNGGDNGKSKREKAFEKAKEIFKD